MTDAHGCMRVVQLGAGSLNHVCRGKESPEMTRAEVGVFGGPQKLDVYFPWSLDSGDHHMTIILSDDTLIKFIFTRGILCFICLNESLVKKCPWAWLESQNLCVSEVLSSK